MNFALLLVALAAPAPTHLIQPGEGPAPACVPQLAETGRVWIGGHVSPLRFERDGRDLLPNVTLWPHDARSVLLAARPDWFVDPDAQADGVLWKVDCKTAKAAVFFAQDGADFGNAVLQKRGLYFTGTDGAFHLDLRSRKAKRITEAPETDCGDRDESWALESQRDVVAGFQGGRLIVERGTICPEGYDSAWRGRRMQVIDPEGPRPRVRPLQRFEGPS